MNENLLVHTNDKEYKKFLVELKEKVKNSQLKAAVKVNYELLNLYWELKGIFLGRFLYFKFK